MFVNEMATMTAVKVKEVTTSTFSRVVRGMQSVSKIKFFERNRKIIGICLAILLVVNVAGYISYRFAVARTNDAFYRPGLSAAQNLAIKSGPAVLENDILALNVAVNELQMMRQFKFAAILDHKNNILAHTDPGMIDNVFESLQNDKPIDTTDGSTITAGMSPDKTKVVSFFENIVFSEVEIGRVCVALSATELDQRLNRLRSFYLFGIVLTIVLLSIVLLGSDRWVRAKALKLKKEFESMQRIGPYLLQKKVARGGMAELYLADYVREDGFRRKVAVKRILPHLAGNTDFINMFTREARLAALLQHPNIVQIFDYGNIEHSYFIAMEYIDGKNLGEVLSILKQGLSVDQAVFIISKISKGLDYSHSKKDDTTAEALNIVHRDISPQNMLISYQGEVKISDFGISKAKSEPSLTQAGVVKGKLAYLSPEQALGEQSDRRADIYALGLVFYETLTGKRVYSFKSDVEAIRSIPTMNIDPLSNVMPEIPAELNRIVMKCLEKNKGLRYQSASDLYRELAAFRKEHNITIDTSVLADFMRKNFKKRVNSSQPK